MVRSEATICTSLNDPVHAYETGAIAVETYAAMAKALVKPAQSGQPFWASEGCGTAGRSDAAIRSVLPLLWQMTARSASSV